MEESPKFNIQALLNFSLNSISILCGLIVSTILIWAMIRHSKLVNRISLRLTLAIALVDVIKGIGIILLTFNDYTEKECIVLTFSLHWLILFYILLNTIILFNVYVVFILEYHGYFKLEWCYWTVVFLFPTLVLLPALVRNKFGIDFDRGYCGYKNIADYETIIYNWTGFYVWLFIFNIGAIYMITRIILKLLPTKNSTSLTSKYNMRNLVIRITLQCFIPIITHIPFVAFFTLLQFQIVSKYLTIISIIFTDIPGILNLILFTFDPVFKPLWRVRSQTHSQSLHPMSDFSTSLEVPTINWTNSDYSRRSFPKESCFSGSLDSSTVFDRQNFSYNPETVKKL